MINSDPPTRTPRKTSTPGAYVFLGNLPKNPNSPSKSEPKPLPIDPNLLAGLAAVSAAADATATALLMRKRREEELHRKAKESRAEAETRANAANQARLQGHLDYLARKKAQQKVIEKYLLLHGNIQNAQNKTTHKLFDKLTEEQKKAEKDAEVFLRAERRLGFSVFKKPVERFDYTRSEKKFIADEKRFDKSFSPDLLDAIRSGSFVASNAPYDQIQNDYERQSIVALRDLMKTAEGFSFAEQLWKNNMQVIIHNKSGSPIYTFGAAHGTVIPVSYEAYIRNAYGVTDFAKDEYGVNTGKITLLNKSIPGYKAARTLLHEIQHAIDIKQWLATEVDNKFTKVMSIYEDIKKNNLDYSKQVEMELETAYSSHYSAFVATEVRAHFQGYLLNSSPKSVLMGSSPANTYINNNYVLYARRYLESYGERIRSHLTQVFPDSDFGVTVYAQENGTIVTNIQNYKIEPRKYKGR